MRSTLFPGVLGVRAILFLAAAACGLAQVPAASAFMDNGGRISRDFAKGTLQKNGKTEQIVLFTWAGSGQKRDSLTLFALCADGDCASDFRPAMPAGTQEQGDRDHRCFDEEWEEDHAEDSERSGWPFWSDKCDPDQGCLWAFELPRSRGNLSYAPPVVSDDDLEDRVYVATTNHGGGGSLWAFDLEGNCEWSYRPTEKSVKPKGGFYARPAVQTLQEQTGEEGSDYGRVIIAPSLNSSKMHVVYDEPADSGRSGEPWNNLDPIPVDEAGKSGGRVRFEPIVECDKRCAQPVVYVGAEGGGKKRGLYKFTISSDRDSDEGPDWRILDPALSMRIGGVMLKSTSGKKFIVANLGNTAGTAVFAVSARDHCENSPNDYPNCCEKKDEDDKLVDDECFAVHAQENPDTENPEFEAIRGAHRSHPALDCSGGNGCDTVYVSQKEGGQVDGGKVWKFKLKEGARKLVGATNAEKWDSVFQNGWGEETVSGVKGQKPWPVCDDGEIPTTSWSSPAVSLDGEFVFVGSRQGNAKGGIYRLRTDGSCPGESSTDNWLEFASSDSVPNGLRTTGIFTTVKDGDANIELVHFGSSEDRFYSMKVKDVDSPSIFACYDMEGEDGEVQGGPCPSNSDNPRSCCHDMTAGQ